jgi:hypothetical protein
MRHILYDRPFTFEENLPPFLELEGLNVTCLHVVPISDSEMRIRGLLLQACCRIG